MPRAEVRITGRAEYDSGVGEHRVPYAIMTIESGPVYVMPSIYQDVHPQVNIEASFEIDAETYTQRLTDLHGQMFQLVAGENSLDLHLPHLPGGGFHLARSGGIDWRGQRALQHTILLSGLIAEPPAAGEAISDHIVSGHRR